MAIKIFSGIVAILLLVAFLLPYMLKMKNIALWIVILIGLAMMSVDLWQSLQSKDD